MAPARARSAQAEEPQAQAAPANGGNGAERGGEGRRTATLNLPFVTAQFRRPDLHLPRLGRPDVGAAAGAAAAKARSLSPAELAYYAGLGLLTVVELIEWPVALAVGAGTALARSGRTGGGGRDAGDTSAHDTGAGDTGAGGGRGSPGAQAEGSK
ncbi:MAG: hypothetical protein QOI36_1067, partial [Pseudonocardiales bacterium]|nr:hypothetical protein [Pseudonocardiales bacterium]